MNQFDMQLFLLSLEIKILIKQSKDLLEKIKAKEKEPLPTDPIENLPDLFDESELKQDMKKLLKSTVELTEKMSALRILLNAGKLANQIGNNPANAKFNFIPINVNSGGLTPMHLDNDNDVDSSNATTIFTQSPSSSRLNHSVMFSDIRQFPSLPKSPSFYFPNNKDFSLSDGNNDEESYTPFTPRRGSSGHH